MGYWKKPTQEQVDGAIARLAHVGQHRYFFDRLENPEWVQPLWMAGYFTAPCDPVHNDERGTVSFPPWPESRYLARMAKHTPDLIVRIIKTIPQTENTRVHEDFADAANSMPAEFSAFLVDDASRWILSPYKMLLPEKLGSLASHLARGHQTSAALKLARTLLEIRKVKRQSVPSNRPGAICDVPMHIRSWEYCEIVRNNLPDLVQEEPINTLSLICDLLADAIAAQKARDSADAPEDFSFVWRPAIEHDSFDEEDIANTLVSTLRDTTKAVLDAGKLAPKVVVRLVEERPWWIFTRLSLHLLSEKRQATAGLASRRLADRRLFNSRQCEREYALLLRHRFVSLSPRHKAAVLQWITSGPDLARYRREIEESFGKVPADEDCRTYSDHWTLKRLGWLGQHLPHTLEKLRHDLVEKLGEPQDPQEAPDTDEVWTGPTSPKTSEELRAMSVQETLAFIREWTPPDGCMVDSAEGLARELETVVEADAASYAAAAKEFQNTSASYIRALFYGLQRAASQAQRFDWRPVLALCKWAVTNTAAASRGEKARSDSGDWKSVRRSVARLLSVGFRADDGLPFSERGIAWDILAALASDEEPTRAFEVEYGGSNMDPPTLAINTVRGEAFHAVAQYGLWVLRSLTKLDNVSSESVSFKHMPEVSSLLELHLDTDIDSSLAIRSVYGQFFPWLVLIDEKWAGEHVDLIFPKLEELYAFWDAAWGAYIRFCPAYDNVLRLLIDKYCFAVSQLEVRRTERRKDEQKDEHLAAHIMTFYWRGKISFESSDELFQSFWRKASPKLKASAIDFLGRSLLNTSGEIPGETLERFVKLWEWRVLEARNAEEAQHAELAAFGAWFISEKFDYSWSIEQLFAALTVACKITFETRVLKLLARMSVQFPLLSVKCLDQVIRQDDYMWDRRASHDDARVILRAAIDSEQREAREIASALINYSGSRGALHYRDLLT